MNIEENEIISDKNNKSNNPLMNKKQKRGFSSFVPYIFVIAILVVIGMLIFPKFFFGDENGEKGSNTTNTSTDEPSETPPPAVSKFKIFDTTKNNKPYAVSINNTPVAVKVQEGLNKAYIIYELPTEGNTSRLLAVFKDVDDLTVGTVRSCRHNFIDYANDNDAILVCFGWSHYAQQQLDQGAKAGTIEYLNGNESYWASAFWRSNPEKLAREHTAYTNLSKIKDFTISHKYRLTSDNIQLLNYTTDEIDLSTNNESKSATTVNLPYGSITTKFTYDENTKMYTRVVNGTIAKDHNTKEPFTTKNIIIVKIGHSMMPDNYYWDLKTTGTGKGYYVTNGKYIPITWKKETRNSKIKFLNNDGSELQVNDGRTYIEVHTTSKTVSIS